MPSRRAHAASARRLRLAALLLAFGVAAIVIRLGQLQGLDATAYAAQAQDQRLHTVLLPAVRGEIVDRNGAPLALSVQARLVSADPKFVTDPAGEAAKLAPLLGSPATDLAHRLGRHSRYVVLAHDVMPQVANQIEALNLAGVYDEPESMRVYPGGNLAAGVVGFVGYDGHGVAGAEATFDRLLAGKPGREVDEVGSGGSPIPTGLHMRTDPTPGETVQLTIDRDIQWEAQQAIDKQVAATGSASGSAIVMDPRTGEVLALATAPSYDPNHPAPDAFLGNRAISDVYEPGSVNKVITAAAALEQGVVAPESPIDVPPTISMYGHTFHDAEPHGLEHLTFAGVLAKSSNLGTIEVALRMSHQTLYSYLRAFGFGQRTGVDLPGESPGILPPPDQWSDTQGLTIPFGQGVSVNAMQVASVYATVANGGVRVAPHLVAATVDATGHVHRYAPGAPRRVITAQVAGELRNMLEAVTSNEGTAPAAQIAGYRIAGKTGTSQRPDPTCHCYRGYTASFVGFAPADKPQLVVEVVLQNPSKGAHFGGLIAAPIFHDVMGFALASRHILPTGTRPPVIRLTRP